MVLHRDLHTFENQGNCVIFTVAGRIQRINDLKRIVNPDQQAVMPGHRRSRHGGGPAVEPDSDDRALIPERLDSLRDYVARLLPQAAGEVIYTQTRGRQAVNNAYLTFLGATTPTAINAALANDLSACRGVHGRNRERLHGDGAAGQAYGGVTGYPATRGWDPTTGLGSANTGALVKKLLA